MNRPAAALDHYRSGQQIYEALLTRNAADAKIRRGLSVVHEHMGTLLLQNKQLENALANNRRALALRSDLVAEFPLNADYRRTLLVSHYNDGEILSAMGRTSEALRSYQKNLAIAEELLASDPNNEQYRGDLAYALIRVGDMSAVTSPSQAVESYCRSRTLRSQDVRKDPSNLWKRSSLIEAEVKLAAALAKSGRHADASAAYSAALSMMDHTTIEPTNPLIRSFFATTYAGLGEAQAVMAGNTATESTEWTMRWRLAREMYGRSLVIWRDLRYRGILSSLDAHKIDAVTTEIQRCDRMMSRNARSGGS